MKNATLAAALTLADGVEAFFITLLESAESDSHSSAPSAQLCVSAVNPFGRREG